MRGRKPLGRTRLRGNYAQYLYRFKKKTRL